MRFARHAIALLFGCASCSLIVDGDILSVHCDDEGALGPPACPLDERCVGHICVKGAQAAPKLGSACANDSECAEGDFCLDPADFGDNGARACSRPCCSSSGCDPDRKFVCWAPDVGGGDFCVAAAKLGRADVGKGAPGEPCDVGEACRSGKCAGGHCDDPCCSDTNCSASGDRCQLGVTGTTHTWACAKASSKKELYDACSSDDQCVSGLCIDVGGSARCSIPCCSSESCSPLLEVPVQMVACDDVVHEGTRVRACATIVPDSATGLVGTECKNDEQCRSARCVKNGESGFCGDVCCEDSDCGDPMFVCRPSHEVLVPVASWALRCQRK